MTRKLTLRNKILYGEHIISHIESTNFSIGISNVSWQLITYIWVLINLIRSAINMNRKKKKIIIYIYEGLLYFCKSFIVFSKRIKYLNYYTSFCGNSSLQFSSCFYCFETNQYNQLTVTTVIDYLSLNGHRCFCIILRLSLRKAQSLCCVKIKSQCILYM